MSKFVMQLTLVAVALVLAAMTSVDGASSGNVGTCKFNFDSKSTMPWATPASWNDKAYNMYSLRAGQATKFGSLGYADPTTWTAGIPINIHLKVKKAGFKYRGLLIVAEDAKGNRVGKFNFKKGESQFWTPPICGGAGKAVVHRDANEKNIHHTWNWSPPAKGTGKVFFRTVIKHGPANTGKFYWLPALVLGEKAPGAKAKYIRSKRGQSCDQACNSQGQNCDLYSMKRLVGGGPEAFAKAMDSIFRCEKYSLNCGGTQPATSSGSRDCRYPGSAAECKAIGKTAQPISCSVRSTSWQTGFRFCACSGTAPPAGYTVEPYAEPAGEPPVEGADVLTEAEETSAAIQDECPSCTAAGALEAEDSKGTFDAIGGVAGLAGASGGFLLIAGITIGVCLHRKRRNDAAKDTKFMSDAVQLA